MTTQTIEAAGGSQLPTAAPCPEKQDPRFAFLQSTITALSMASMWQVDALRALADEDVDSMSKELRILHRDLSSLAEALRLKLVPEDERDILKSHMSVWYETHKSCEKADADRAQRAN